MGNFKIRKEVYNTLNKMLESERPEFLALYGRRRIGKTFTIRDCFEGKKNIIFFDVTGSKDAPMFEQISNFTGRLGQIFYNEAQLAQQKNWNRTFKLLTDSITRAPANKKIVLFFDEFPSMTAK